MIKVKRNRLDVWQEEPLYWDHIIQIDKRLNASSVPRRLLELIRIRVSQINKCVYCIDYHTDESLKQGESPRKIFALLAWEESLLFTDSEKSALRAADEITHISHNGLSDGAYENLRTFFSTKEIADIIICISHVNFLNRVGISTKTVSL